MVDGEGGVPGEALPVFVSPRLDVVAAGHDGVVEARAEGAECGCVRDLYCKFDSCRDKLISIKEIAYSVQR